MKAFLKKILLDLLWAGVAKKIGREKPYVIAITGSVGKTSTKEAIASVLSQTGRPVVKSAGNLGTDFGIPLSLFGFAEQPDGIFEWLTAAILSFSPPRTKGTGRPYYILEYSAEKPGDIPFLAHKIPIDVGVLTTITPVHMEFYGDFSKLVAEKSSLFEGLIEGGYAVLNGEDVEQEPLAIRVPNVQWYGQQLPARKSGTTIKEIKPTEKGLLCSLSFTPVKTLDSVGKTKPQQIEVQTSVIGVHQLYPLLAAATIGFREGLRASEVKAGLEAYVLPNGRGRVIAGIKECSIIDDSYNSSPEAVKAGLAMLRPFADSRRTIAVLGTMNELGSMAESAHMEVAQAAANTADYLIFVGTFATKMVEVAVKAGKDPVQVIGFSTTAHLIDKAEHLLQNRDVIYVKGSQNGVRLERFVKRIMAHPEDAQALLARQSSFWSKHS
jgi:UDP-N-acetylmuramyl pentapeptide synthase